MVYAKARRPRCCTCCGKSGHTVTTCKSTAARQIRSLLQKLRLREGQRRTKPRVGIKKSGVHAKTAAQQYTPNPVAGRRAGQRRDAIKSAWSSGGRRAEFFRRDAISPESAVEQLLDLGVIRKPRKCSLCGGGLSNLCKYGTRSPHYRYWRCTSYDCHARFNVLQFSPFWPTVLAPSQLLALLKKYSRPDSIAPPAPSKLCLDAGCGKQQALKFTSLCRKAEAKQGEMSNKRGSIGGDVEIDVHQVAKVYVSPQNPVYQHLIREKYKKNLPKYFLLYLRVAGAVERGCGRLYIDFLPEHFLLPPKSRPPPESYAELESCTILDRVRVKANLHIDGNKSWPKLMKTKYTRKGFKMPSVSHCGSQFTKVIRGRTVEKKRLSKLAGTQAIDRSWKEMDRAIPHTLNKKSPLQGSTHRVLNTELYDRVWSWLHRFNGRYSETTPDGAVKSLATSLWSL